jgi:FtsZ-interacting cell division protein ZipA
LCWGGERGVGELSQGDRRPPAHLGWLCPVRALVDGVWKKRKKKKRKKKNKSGRIQHSTLINGEIMETQTKQSHIETNRSYETKGFNIPIEHFILKQKNIPSSQHLTVPSPKLTI